ncbi:MAG: alpha/beta fold hydrolase [Sarcina sp.]
MRNLKKIDIDDFIMSYYEEGEGECIIFLHGNGMNSTQFSKLYNKLVKFKKCIALDVRGSGQSSRGLKVITMEQIALDIITFLEKKNITKASFIGYSDGANLAMIIAKKKPECINKLALIVGNYKIEGICIWFRVLLIIYRYVLKIKMIFSHKARIRLELAELMFDDIDISDEDLMNFDMDTLVMYSGLDVIKKSHSLKIGKLIKNSEIVLIKNSTHENIIRNSSAINKLVLFLK